MFNFNNTSKKSKDFKENSNFKFAKLIEDDNSTLNEFKKCKIIDVNDNTYEGLYSRNKHSINNEYKYKYYIRSDMAEENFTVEPFVVIDFYGLFFTNTEIKFPKSEESNSTDHFLLDQRYIEVKSLEIAKDDEETTEV